MVDIHNCVVGKCVYLIMDTDVQLWQSIMVTHDTIRSSDNDSTGFWPPGSLHTLGADGHI